MTQTATNQPLPNRWLLAGGCFLMQLALGAVLRWSVFRDPLIKSYGWSISGVTLTFSTAILAQILRSIPVLQLILFADFDLVAGNEAMLQQ
jgi:hypothetical protein